jgi:hypothetical protein
MKYNTSASASVSTAGLLKSEWKNLLSVCVCVRGQIKIKSGASQIVNLKRKSNMHEMLLMQNAICLRV